MKITIDIASCLIGFFLGYVLLATIFLYIFFNKRHGIGFSDGWNYGYKYGREEAEKELEVKDE